MPYRSVDGSEARCRQRTALVAKEGSFWLGSRDQRIHAYGEHELAEARTRKALIIAEGESDFWTLRHAGFPALGIPGAEMVKVLSRAHIEGIARVYITQDRDAAGASFVAKAREQLRGFGLTSVFAVPMPDGYKDVNDLYRANPATFKATFTDLLKAARTVPVETGTVTAPAVGPILVRLADVTPRKISWLWRRRIARGKMTLLMGDPGAGKSFITADVASRVSRGAPWPDGDSAPLGDVVFLAAEDGLEDTLRPRMDALGADVSRIHVFTGVIDREGSSERPFSLKTDIAQLDEAIQKYRPALIVIDPLNSYFGDKDAYKDTEVRSVLLPLVQLAERTNVALLAITHVTKSAQGKALYRALGSIGFAGVARIQLAAGALPEDPERRYLMPVKQNANQAATVLAYRITPTEDPDVARFEWERDPVQGVTADGVFGAVAKSLDEQSAIEDAVTFLRELLEDGPMPAIEIIKLAKTEGISEATLRRARLVARVGHHKNGFKGGFVWFLQSKSAEVAHEDAQFW
jgi:hypothetical protein